VESGPGSVPKLIEDLALLTLHSSVVGRSKYISCCDIHSGQQIRQGAAEFFENDPALTSVLVVPYEEVRVTA
jgi:hypothetical protein